jgi:hypothetical protein
MFRSPQLPHPFLIVGLDRGEKLRHRLVHRLRNRTRGTLPPPACGGDAAGQDEETNREPSLHEAGPVVKVTRR